MDTAEGNQSPEYGFEPGRNTAEEGDSPQAEASEYGIYGYAGHATGETYEGDTSHDDPLEAPAARPPGVDATAGGQDREETGHGAGYAQPLEEPQRSASRSRLPGEP